MKELLLFALVPFVLIGGYIWDAARWLVAPLVAVVDMVRDWLGGEAHE